MGLMEAVKEGLHCGYAPWVFSIRIAPILAPHGTRSRPAVSSSPRMEVSMDAIFCPSAHVSPVLGRYCQRDLTDNRESGEMS